MVSNNDPNYQNKLIYSDLSPNFSWYLNTNVKQLPVSNSNSMINKYLASNGVEYYLSDSPRLNLSSYMLIKQFGNVTIYKKKE